MLYFGFGMWVSGKGDMALSLKPIRQTITSSFEQQICAWTQLLKKCSILSNLRFLQGTFLLKFTKLLRTQIFYQKTALSWAITNWKLWPSTWVGVHIKPLHPPTHPRAMFSLENSGEYKFWTLHQTLVMNGQGEQLLGRKLFWGFLGHTKLWFLLGEIKSRKGNF